MREISRKSAEVRLPANSARQPVLDRASELARAGGGPFAVFEADRGTFEAEIDRETARREFTFGELEEEEQRHDGYAEQVHHVMRVTTPAMDMAPADPASTGELAARNGTIG